MNDQRRSLAARQWPEPHYIAPSHEWSQTIELRSYLATIEGHLAAERWLIWGPGDAAITETQIFGAVR